MKTLCTLFALFVLFIVGIFLLPVVIPLVFTLGFAFIWFLPILFILASDVTSSGEKLAWILAIIFLSWFAWIFYFLVAPIKKRPDYENYRDYRYS